MLAIRYADLTVAAGTGSIRVTKDARVFSQYAIRVPGSQYKELIAGPASLDVSGTASTAGLGIITYSLLPAQGLQTVVIDAGKTNMVSVPTGKTMMIVSPSSLGSFPTLSVRKGDVVKVLSSANIVLPIEIDGATDVEFVGASAYGDPYRGGSYVTYFLADSIAALPNGTVQTSGLSVLVVEKSANLADWSPAYVVFNSGDPQTFYRLKAAQ